MLIFFRKFFGGRAANLRSFLLLAALCALGTYIYAETFELSGVFSSVSEKYIVIIIDDYGYGGSGTDDMLALGVPVTAAIMPGLATSAEDAKKYYDAGCDVILHMPMEPHSGKSSWLGPFGLTTRLSDETINDNVTNGLEIVRYAVGMNNHMGSKIMENERIISRVMAIAAEKNLIFVDSRTTQKSVAKKLADEAGVRYYERDIFLDQVKTTENTRKQMLKAAEIADKKGYAIVIGHVGAAGGMTTFNGIKQALPGLLENGYKFITISDLDMRISAGMLEVLGITD